MADNTNQSDNLEYIQELLSGYLDGEVTDEERTLVEQALATSADLRQELDSLRQVVTAVRALPPVPAPRPFTLSETDVQQVAPAAKRAFWWPGWASGLALFATAVVCALIGGTIVLNSQFGLGAYAPAEVARVQQEAASAVEEAEADQDMVEEDAGQTQAMPADTEPRLATEAEKEAAGPVAEGNEEATTEVEEAIVGGADDEALSAAGQSPAAGSEKALQPANGLAEDGSDQADSAARAVPTLMPAATGTPPPLPTPTAMPTAEAIDEAVAGEAVAEADSAVAAEPEAAAEPAEPMEEASMDTAEEPAAEAPLEAQPAPSPAAELGDESGQSFRQETARLVDIQDLQLHINPGLIQITGVIEAPPDTVLEASLQQAQLPFDVWAEPASLRSVVRSDGQFFFEIRARPDRDDVDLFSIEPATYRITIISTTGENPIAATVFFDTTRAPVTAEPTAVPPTSTPSPTPSSTPTPQPRPTSPVEPTATVAVTAPPAAETAAPGVVSPVGLIVGVVLILGLVILVVVGVVIWFTLSRRG